jgi:hypothetical protein
MVSSVMCRTACQRMAVMARRREARQVTGRELAGPLGVLTPMPSALSRSVLTIAKANRDRRVQPLTVPAANRASISASRNPARRRIAGPSSPSLGGGRRGVGRSPSKRSGCETVCQSPITGS